MKTLVIFAVTCNTGAHHLCKAVDVICLDVESCFHLVAHLVGPGLSTADSGLKLDLVDEACLLKIFCNVQEIRRCACDRSNVAVDHHVDELLCITCGHRENQCSEIFGTIVCTKTTCEESVAVTYLDDVILCDPCH